MPNPVTVWQRHPIYLETPMKTMGQPLDTIRQRLPLPRVSIITTHLTRPTGTGGRVAGERISCPFTFSVQFSRPPMLPQGVPLNHYEIPLLCWGVGMINYSSASMLDIMACEYQFNRLNLYTQTVSTQETDRGWHLRISII